MKNLDKKFKHDLGLKTNLNQSDYRNDREEKRRNEEEMVSLLRAISENVARMSTDIEEIKESLAENPKEVRLQ